MRDLKIYSQWFNDIKRILSIHEPSIIKDGENRYVVDSEIRGSSYLKKIIGVISLEGDNVEQLEDAIYVYIFEKLQKKFSLTNEKISGKRNNIWTNCVQVLLERLFAEEALEEIYSELFGGILECSDDVKDILIHNFKAIGLTKELQILLEYWKSDSITSNIVKKESSIKQDNLMNIKDLEVAAALIAGLEGLSSIIPKEIMLSRSNTSSLFYQNETICFIVKLSDSAHRRINFSQQEYELLTQNDGLVKKLYVVEDMYIYPKIFLFEDINKKITEGILTPNLEVEQLMYQSKKEYQKY